MPLWQTLNFQEAASSSMELISNFHDILLCMFLIVMTTLSWLALSVCKNKTISLKTSQHHLLEMVWSIIPLTILISIAIPSLHTLYSCDELLNPLYSVKINGNQWFWNYEICEPINMEFDSFMIPQSPLRNMDVDNRLTLPFLWEHRLLITSSDVIHSWTIPCLGVKADAIPGRINQIPLSMFMPGVFFGQCSEICGMNHSFMPIVLQSVSMKCFLKTIEA